MPVPVSKSKYFPCYRNGLSTGPAPNVTRNSAPIQRQGQLIGGNDMQIAATALAHGLILVTHNTREFSRVPGLQLEDWQI
jgi:predicted nucleic acid-binding protein